MNLAHLTPAPTWTTRTVLPRRSFIIEKNPRGWDLMKPFRGGDSWKVMTFRKKHPPHGISRRRHAWLDGTL